MNMDINGGFPGGSDGKESACKARDLGSVSGQEEPLMNTSYPLQYSCVCVYVCVCVCAQSCPSLCDPMDCSCQAPLSMEFCRQEYWRGLLFPPPGDLPDPGIEPMPLVSPALAGGFFTTILPGKPYILEYIGIHIKM